MFFPPIIQDITLNKNQSQHRVITADADKKVESSRGESDARYSDGLSFITFAQRVCIYIRTRIAILRRVANGRRRCTHGIFSQSQDHDQARNLFLRICK